MSSLPKWINDAVVNVMSSKFRDCTIIRTEYISAQLCRIQFKANLENLYFEPAYAIGIRVNERDIRNYSPFNFNVEEGCFEVIFHLHDKASAACRFIGRLSENDSLKILIPRGRRFFAPDAKIHFSVGDETSLGTSISIKEAAEKADSLFLCLHELDQPEYLESLGLFGYYVGKNNPLQLIETLKEFLREEKWAINHDEVVFYLTGNGQTMALVRKFLKANGVSARCIRSQAYWIEGKKGL